MLIDIVKKRAQSLKWLGVVTEAEHSDALKAKDAESGKWLLNSSEFNNWLSASSSSFLWLNGIGEIAYMVFAS